LIASDDGSTDESRAVVHAFARAAPEHAVSVKDGPKLGWPQNYLKLIRAAGPATPYAAFCDQDDAWFPDKLTRAIAQLRQVPVGIPALYGARTIIADDALRALRPSPLLDRPPSFRNALVQSIAGGNTMVMNRAALDILQSASFGAEGIASHDWWAYQVVAGAGGRIIYDHRPALLYRQHGGNLVGANDTLGASIIRLAKVLGGRFRGWNEANIQALENVAHLLTPDARICLADFRRARSRNPINRLAAIRRAGFYRQTRRGCVALWFAAALGKL
jgi:glycosyltransferase involved in cell wall biosynthesis